MAIEFNCPYCTSTIRVKDNAAGKRGKCPRCSKQLLVPDPRPPKKASVPGPVTPPEPVVSNVSPEPSEPIPAPAPTPAPTLEPSTTVPTASAVPTDFPVIAEPQASPTASYSQPRRSRRRRGSGPLVMGILGVCFAAIVGLVGYLWWSSQPLVLEGTLEGETVSATNIRPVAVDVVSVSQSIRESVLDGLQELPYSLKSSLVVTEFRAANGQLEIRLVPTTTTTIVRINPKEDSQLAGWLSTQQAALAATRQADLLEATDRFFDDYAAYKANGTRMGDGGYYRNQLGLASTNVSLGYVVEAIAANQACPCVFEDSGGALYFVVPRGTASFTVRGRKLSDGTKPFPGTYTVDCSAIRESFEVIEPPSDSKAEASSEDSETKLEPTDTDEPPAMDAKPSDKMEMEPEMNGMSEMDGMNQ